MEYGDPKKVVFCYPLYRSKTSQVKPNDFLKWAKSDVKGSDKRARGNALGNIKKAIHCRIDEIINSTHLSCANDWDWTKINTDDKLWILKKIGFDKTSIANIITKIRNTFEHRYILPSFDEDKAYRDTLELWLEDSYKKKILGRIGLFDLPIYEVKEVDGKVKEIVLAQKYEGISYFWDTKKQYIKTSDDKSQEVQDLNEMSWKEVLNFEKGFLKALQSKEVYHLSQAKLTKIFTFHRKKVPILQGFMNLGWRLIL